MRRAVVSALAVVAALTVVSGCTAKRELVVRFAATATEADHRAALAACTGAAPHTRPEPMLHSRYRSDRVGDVRFRIDNADDKDISQLVRCLSKQRGVVGIDLPD